MEGRMSRQPEGVNEAVKREVDKKKKQPKTKAEL